MQWEKIWPHVRDVLSFGFGAWAAYHEITIPPVDIPVLIFAGGLMGLPFVLRQE